MNNNLSYKLSIVSGECGLLPTLYAVCGKDIKVILPTFEKTREFPIEILDFSNRSGNGLKRYGVNTIGDLIDLIENDRLTYVKNIGKKCVSEIKTKLLCFCYKRMNERQKSDFWNYVAENNQTVKPAA